MFLTVLEFPLLQHFVLEALNWLHIGEILTCCSKVYFSLQVPASKFQQKKLLISFFKVVITFLQGKYGVAGIFGNNLV